MMPFIIVMGVSGCGKTTIAEALAGEIGGVYLEGDSFHPPENKAKMGEGFPLTDADRWPWFGSLVNAAREVLDHGRIPVLACSALKQSYRDYLLADFDDWRLIFLEGSFDLIKSRMDSRHHEYMKSDLLRSQFETLEPPAPGPRVLEISIDETPKELVSAILSWLNLDAGER